MITRLKRISVHNFKCFQSQEISLGLLTLLCGINGGGKSTLLQSILLYSQALRAFRVGVSDMAWPLNGELTNLGRFVDVLHKNPYQSQHDNVIRFKYELVDPQSTEFHLVPDETGRFLKCNEKTNQNCPDLTDLISNVQFLSSGRLGSSQKQEKSVNSSYFPEGVGTDGRYACYWFDKLKYESLPAGMCRVDSGVSDFRNQLSSWLDFIFPGAEVNAILSEDFDSLSLFFRTNELSEWNIPSNVGYGISYLFPVLVLLLAARPGNFVIIDSPEAHLHPSAQYSLGKMLAIFASIGIQIMVETHSEHILRGVQAVVKSGVIEPDDVSVYSFPNPYSQNEKVKKREIDSSGLLSY